jgi:hypothetical protein
MADLKDFHYMAVLRDLEIEAGKLKGGAPKSTDRKAVNRLIHIYRRAKHALSEVKVEAGEKISLNLKYSRDNQRRTEKALATNLRALTEATPHGHAEHGSGGEWPPVISAHRMVEKFSALAIGLQSEQQDRPFAEHVRDAFRAVVAPALTWGMMISLHELPEELKSTAQSSLSERLADGRHASLIEVPVGRANHQKVKFATLRLVEAWFALFAGTGPCRMPDPMIAELREELARRFREPLQKIDADIWQELCAFYVRTPAGSERARVVAMAGGAAFVRARLVLFEAATSGRIHDFRLKTEQRMDEAVRQTFACERPAPTDRTDAGLEACGAAFWLARACFARHGKPHEDTASERTVILLLRAALMLRNDADQMMTCLRYAAGFATNPRYARAEIVLDRQSELVELYARLPNSRQALCEQFRGRIAWQQWKAGDKSAKGRALKHYMEALRRHDRDGEGLDSEGPVHFFPELVTLLQQADDGKRAEADLRTVDLITQRNYGIYFDIEKEAAALEAGLEAFAGRQRNSETKKDAGHRLCDALIAELRAG